MLQWSGSSQLSASRKQNRVEALGHRADRAACARRVSGVVVGGAKLERAHAVDRTSKDVAVQQ